MQTMLRLDDGLYRKAKMSAASLGISLTRFLEEAIDGAFVADDAPNRQVPNSLRFVTAFRLTL